MNAFDATNIGRIRHQELIDEAERRYRFRDAKVEPTVFSRLLAALRAALTRRAPSTERQAGAKAGVPALSK